MVLGQIYYMIQIESTTTRTTQEINDVTSKSNNNNKSPLLALLDIFLYCAIFSSKLQSSFSKFWSFLLSQLPHSNPVPSSSDPDEPSRRHEGLSIRGHEARMVMEKLGFSCSSESDEEVVLEGGNCEFCGLFEEEEPSLEEVKQAFDVFDENGDGFIDGRELQRVLCVLGLKEASEMENCQKMIRNFDENGDGRIDFNEFVKERITCNYKVISDHYSELYSTVSDTPALRSRRLSRAVGHVTRA
ncbi:putative calcium-binding protein CML45 [Senna tora]|uniref:Putative calcium-binding protein CML45 n=1 Tax=Senna tora TaxID=362788 RepID=A0A834WEP0_9FABA|nr:putative calcium-binding protein CML45 [Senna tora]